MARGHRVDKVPELPLVIDNLNVSNTKTMLKTLLGFGLGDDLTKVRRSKKTRSGHGKYRNSRYVMRKGPLIVYEDSDGDVKRLARNLPGVDSCNVHRLNVLQLAPGGHVGRLVVFTKDAFKALNTVFGTDNAISEEKSGYHLNRTVMSCADIARIINSDQVQSKLREVRTSVRTHFKNKVNPLKNKTQMLRLNPFAKKKAELIAAREADRHAKRAAALKAKQSKAGRKEKSARSARFTNLQDELKASFKDAEDLIAEEERQGNYQPGDSDEGEKDD